MKIEWFDLKFPPINLWNKPYVRKDFEKEKMNWINIKEKLSDQDDNVSVEIKEKDNV